MPPLRYLLLAAVTVSALIWLAADPRGLRHTRRLADDLEQVHERNGGLRAKNEVLRRELELLADDPAALERAAREELGLVRPGEVIFRLEEEGDEAARP
ncbi:FtsB family cell division protein [Vulgatibacter sp.]|uniref:FtsB family cell division protein n=1 Tax=Vulgatibacter sp. TaxID=1971226 RepID=UPI00356513A1